MRGGEQVVTMEAGEPTLTLRSAAAEGACALSDPAGAGGQSGVGH